MKFFVTKYYPAFLLGIIMLFAFAVRSYHFDDWLYYKWDQGRDSMVIAKAAQDGPGYLPLLGPRATKVNRNGDFLRLGPAYFYFQYVSAKLSNSIDPPAFAYPDLFFSIAVLPLLYLLFRIYFSKHTSLLLLTLYAFSFIIIQYSRFSWNPNSVPFFTVLSFYGLLKFVNSPNSKHRIWFLVCWATGLAIASQLHYFAAFSLIGISGLFLFIRYQLWNLKPACSTIATKQTIKYVLAALVVVAVLYTPFIISEIKTNGDNFNNFVKAFSTKPKDKPFVDKLGKDLLEQTNNFYLILTSYMYGNFDKKGNLLSNTVGGFFILSGLWLAFRSWKREQDSLKKDFLLLTMIWLLVFVVVCIPMAYQLRPRFFVVVFAIAYIFLGLWFNFLAERLGKKALPVLAAIFAIVFFLNIQGTYAWFLEQEKSQVKAVDVHRTIILKRKDGVTLGQMKRAVDYMYAQSKDTMKLSFSAKAEYNTPYMYLFFLKDKNLEATRLDKKGIDPDSHLFVIDSVGGKNSSIDKNWQDKLEIIQTKQFGQIQVSELKLKDASAVNLIKLDGQSESDELDEDLGDEDTDKDNRLYWKDVINF